MQADQPDPKVGKGVVTKHTRGVREVEGERDRLRQRLDSRDLTTVQRHVQQALGEHGVRLLGEVDVTTVRDEDGEVDMTRVGCADRTGQAGAGGKSQRSSR